MGNATGKPENMKKLNIELLYHALIGREGATRAELAEKTQISITTIRSLLQQLCEKGEIIESSVDESTGGRRATRYALNPNKNQILTLYYLNDCIAYRVYSLAGKTLHEQVVQKSVYQDKQHLFDVIDECVKGWNIVAIGLGVPGIVDNSNYIHRLGLDEWDTYEIGKQIKNAYGLPLTLENDLNAIALGYTQKYGGATRNMAYIHFDKGCVCAGFIAGGKIIHGASRYAGELSYMPYGEDSGTLLEAVQSAKDEAALLPIIMQAVNGINCVINPSVVVLGGERLQNAGKETTQKLRELAKEQIPSRVQPEILIRHRYQDDYLTGLIKLSIERLVPLIINKP